MPTAPPIACPCGGRKVNGKCDRCNRGKQQSRREYDQRRGSSTERGYDAAWQRFRKGYLMAHPLCVDCEAMGIVAAARDIHHIAKLRDNPEAKYDESNLMGLCKMHHDMRTAKGE